MKLVFSNKTHTFYGLDPGLILKRKGNIIENPTEDQLENIELNFLKKAGFQIRPIRYLKIKDSSESYESNLSEQDYNTIDTILIKKAPKTIKTAYPMFQKYGASFHLFIDHNGLVEQILPYTKKVKKNTIVLYYYSKNSFPPENKRFFETELNYKIYNSLLKLLVVLTLQFKIDPERGIKFDSNIYDPEINKPLIITQIVKEIKKRLSLCYEDYKWDGWKTFNFTEKTILYFNQFPSYLIGKYFYIKEQPTSQEVGTLRSLHESRHL